MPSLLQVSRYSQVFLQFLKSAYGIICVFSSLWIGTYAALKNDEEKEVASVGGSMLGPVGAAVERCRSGIENPREDARARCAAGFLHDVFDVLFDRLFGNGERVRDFLVRMPFG